MLRSALAFAGALLMAGPAAAATYSATLDVPTSDRFIARDIVWTCGPAACQGATVDGRAFTPAELDRCNASAKAPPARSIASQ
jgi:hypothetical protein